MTGDGWSSHHQEGTRLVADADRVVNEQLTHIAGTSRARTR